MTKDFLLSSARQLDQVASDLAIEFGDKREILVNAMNSYMLKRPDIVGMIGEQNVEMMKDNHSNHARFMESIFLVHNAEIRVDTILWVFRAYKSRGFSSTYWASQLNGWLEVYKNEISPDCYQAVHPYYNWMIINIPAFNKLAEDDLDLNNSAH